jgi:hypothetical protein
MLYEDWQVFGFHERNRQDAMEVPPISRQNALQYETQNT